jgi:hypothetical protein
MDEWLSVVTDNEDKRGCRFKRTKKNRNSLWIGNTLCIGETKPLIFINASLTIWTENKGIRSLAPDAHH